MSKDIQSVIDELSKRRDNLDVAIRVLQGELRNQQRPQQRRRPGRPRKKPVVSK